MKLLATILLFLSAFANNAMAQIPKQPGRCTASISQIYFVQDGQMVMDVYPSAANGYQLNIMGSNADKFEVVKDSYLSSFSVIPNYTSATSAKWQISFAQNNERVLCSIMLKNTCTGETLTYPLTVGVRLFNR